jgi:hypothetical protein
VLAQLARAKREFIAAPGAPPDITTKSSFFSTIWPLVFAAWKAQQGHKAAPTPRPALVSEGPGGTVAVTAPPAAPPAPRKRVRKRPVTVRDESPPAPTLTPDATDPGPEGK